MSPVLPNGFIARPAKEADLPQLAELDAAHTRHVVGRALRTENEIRIEWKSPIFDPMTDSQVVCLPDGKVVGWCEIYDQAPHERIASRLRLSPDLGTNTESVARELIDWAVARARTSLAKASPAARIVLTQGAYDRDPNAALRLQTRGFEFVRCFLRMRIEMPEAPETAAWPDGIEVRAFEKGQDDRPAVAAMIDVFRDHWGFVETSLEEELEEWKQWIYEDEDFDTNLWFLAIDSSTGDIAGFCQCYPFAGEDHTTGLVDELGVRRAWRRRGLGTALLRHAFRAFYDRGVPNVELGVDAESLTGATRLYESAGMKLIWKNDVYELELRPAAESADEKGRPRGEMSEEGTR